MRDAKHTADGQALFHPQRLSNLYPCSALPPVHIQHVPVFCKPRPKSARQSSGFGACYCVQRPRTVQVYRLVGNRTHTGYGLSQPRTSAPY